MTQELCTKLKYLPLITSAGTCSAAMFRRDKCSQIHLCSPRTATFALAVIQNILQSSGCFHPWEHLQTTKKYSHIKRKAEKINVSPKGSSWPAAMAAPNVQHCQWPSRIQWELSSAQNPTAPSCSSLFSQLVAQGRTRVRHTRRGGAQNMCQPPRTTSGAGTDLLGWGAKEKNGRAQGKVSLHLLGWEIDQTPNKLCAFDAMETFTKTSTMAKIS